MTGLALSGGGARGSYQVGCYMALKKCHIRFDGYVGTSIGSFNAAMLAAGQDKELKKFWETINVGKVIGFSEEYLKKIEKNKKHNNLINHIFNNAKDIIKNKGFKTDGLYNIIKEFNLENKIRFSHKDYGLVTVKARSFKPIYKYIEDIPENKLNDYIMASCYLPVFKMQKLIDDNYYLDGGFKDNAPVKMLIDKGYDLIYEVDLEAIGFRRKVDIKDQKKIIKITPSHNLKSILNTNQEDLKYNIKLGYYDTLKKIKKLDGYKYIFYVYSEDFYKYISRKVNKKILKEMEILFNTKNIKVIVIKALELVMQLNKYEYTKIYSPWLVIRKIKKLNHKRGVYKFILELKVI